MDRLAIPQGLRPGMLGLLLVRRVITGDIAATIVDLADQGFVAVGNSPAILFRREFYRHLSEGGNVGRVVYHQSTLPSPAA